MKRRKTLLSTAIILAVALAGLVLINVSHTGASDESAAAAMERVRTDPASAAPAESSFQATALPALGRMVGALAIVIITIYLAVYLFKRMTGGRIRNGRGRQLLEILESTYVAPKKTISLVRVAEKSVLIGVTEAGMTMLTELDADQTALALGRRTQDLEMRSDKFDVLFAAAAERLRKFAPGRDRVADHN